MAMRPTDFAGAVPIDGYGPGFVRVGGTVHYGAVIVGSGGVVPWGGMEDTAALLALAPRPALLLICTGRDVAHAPAALLDALEAAGIRAEAMASRLPGTAALQIVADDETGELESATILGQHGEVPDDFAESLQAA